MTMLLTRTDRGPSPLRAAETACAAIYYATNRLCARLAANEQPLT
ncbi:hypothetical protein AB4305_08115 [Nocardia sp. 2YAB30]